MEWQQSVVTFKGLGHGSLAVLKRVGGDGSCSRDSDVVCYIPFLTLRAGV